MHASGTVQKNKDLLFVYLMFIFIYMTVGTYNPYIALFYESQGLTPLQIGAISSVGPVATILLQTAWGTFADRTSRKGVLCLALIGSAAAAALYLLSASFIYTLVIALLFTVFNMAIEPMAAALGLDFCAKTGRNYAPIRMGGTIGFFLPAFLFFALFEKDLKYVFLIFAILCALSCAVTLLFPLKQEKTGAAAEKEGKKVSMFSLISDPLIIFLLVSNMVAFMGSSCYTYLPLYAKSLGFSEALCGALPSIAAVPEILLFLTIDKALTKVKPRTMILGALMLQAVRLMFTYISGFCGAMTLPVLMVGQLLQAFTYLPCYYCAFPANLKSTAQTLLALATTGVGRVLANLVGGWLSEPEVLGLQSTFLVFSLLVAASILPVYLLARKVKTGAGQDIRM